VKHKDCAKYARALCNFTHLQDRPTDPKALSSRNVQASGVVAALWAGAREYSFRKQGAPLHLYQYPAWRPDEDAKASYLAAWHDR